MSLYERFKKFLDKAFVLVPRCDEATALRDEMLDSLMSKANEFYGTGMDDDEIFDRAVEALGDYTSAINSLKRHPISVIRDPAFQRRVLLKVTIVLLAVAVYLVLSAIFDLWGTLALIIFPTLIAVMYTWSTCEVLYRNFKLRRHATSWLILMGYAVIAITLLFFILWIGFGVKVRYAWVVFSYVPVSFSIIAMVSRKFLRGKPLLYVNWCSLIMTTCSAVFVTSSMLTGLWHPLWILTVLGLVACGFVGVIKLSGKIKERDR